jgi:hypothetical protein
LRRRLAHWSITRDCGTSWDWARCNSTLRDSRSFWRKSVSPMCSARWSHGEATLPATPRLLLRTSTEGSFSPFQAIQCLGWRNRWLNSNSPRWTNSNNSNKRFWRASSFSSLRSNLRHSRRKRKLLNRQNRPSYHLIQWAFRVQLCISRMPW